MGLQIFIALALLKCLTVASQGKNPDVVSATSNAIKSKRPAAVPYIRINTIELACVWKLFVEFL